MPSDAGPRWDVFLSYARIDRSAAAPLADSLRRRGLRVFVDEAEAAGFSSLNRELRAALADSRILLAYYSKTYPQRPSCQHELTAAFLAGQQEGDPRRRIALINPEADTGHILPAELRDTRHWAWPLESDAAERFFHSLDRQLDAVSTPIGDQLPMPTGQPHGFVGRHWELWRLHSLLTRPALPLAETSGPRLCLLTGMPGIGKSVLARQYAALFGAAYPAGAVWVDPYVEVAGVDSRADRLAVAELPADADADRLRAWLRRRPPSEAVLLICDSRLDVPADVITLSGLENDPARQLLANYRDPSGEEERHEADLLTAELGAHPQALHLAGHMVRAAQSPAPYRHVRRAWLSQQHDMVDLAAARVEQLPDGYPADPTPTVRRSVIRLRPAALDALRMLAVLPTAPHEYSTLASVWREATNSPDTLAAALDAVVECGLCAADSAGRWQLPALVRRTVARSDPDPARGQMFAQTAWQTLVGYSYDLDADAAGGGAMSAPPTRAEQDAAFQLQIELATRVSTVRLSSEEGLLREALASLKTVVDSARDCLAALTVARRDSELFKISQRVIDEIRPLLSRWHPRLLDHESVRPSDVGPATHERRWSGHEELRVDLESLQDRLREILEQLETLTGARLGAPSP